MTLASLALSLVVGQFSSWDVAGPDKQLTLQAETLEYLFEERIVRAEGGVLLSSGGLALRAESLEYDLERRTARATGPLIFASGNVVLLAREGTVALENGTLNATGAELLQKTQGSWAEVLARTPDRGAIRRLGANQMSLRAEHLERLAAKRYVARRLVMNPCDCGDRVPDYSISASRADVIPDERAILSWPTIYIRKVPVLIVPALYVPLSSRRSGLLLPRPGFPRNAFSLDQPLYLTLGESYDTTLEAGYVFEAKLGADPRPGMRGPRAGAELRYAPHESTSGRLHARVIDDRNAEIGRPPRGARGEFSLRHGTALPSGFDARADVNMVSDAAYISDEIVDITRDATPYLRSQAWAGWRGADVAASAAGAWYQDLKAPFPTPESRLLGPNSPQTLQRPLVAEIAVPSIKLLGPLRAGGHVSALRYQSMGLFGAPSPERFQPPLPGEAPSQTPAMSLSRLNALPTVTLPGTLGPLTGELYGAARLDLSSYTPDEGATLPATSVSRARGLAGARLSTEAWRVFGEGGNALRHVWIPRLELRALSAQALSRPVAPRVATPDGTFYKTTRVPIDEYDAVPSRGEADASSPALLQGVAAVTTRLIRRQGGELARLEVGQDVDLGRRRLSDLFARLEGRAGFASASAGGHFDTHRLEFSSVDAWGRLQDRRGDAFTLGYRRLIEEGDDRIRAGLDELFSLGPEEGQPSRFSQIDLSATVKPISSVSLYYSAVVQPPLSENTSWIVLQQVAGMDVATACDCWRVGLQLILLRGQKWPKPALVFELKNFGSIGA